LNKLVSMGILSEKCDSWREPGFFFIRIMFFFGKAEYFAADFRLNDSCELIFFGYSV